MAKKIAKTDANQLAYSADVRAAYEVSGKPVAEKAAAVLFRKKRKRRLDLVEVTEMIGELLAEAEDELNAAAAAHADELADDDPIREERDETKLDVNDTLLRFRALILGVFGSRFLKRVGLDRPLEDRPDLVRKLGASVVRLMRKANKKKPTKATKGAAADLEELAGELDSKVERLAELLSSLKREEREAQQTMIARDQAGTHWKAVVTLAGGWLEGLARIAGEHEIADRVRPTERRRAGIRAVEDETDVESEDLEDETDTEADEADTDSDVTG